jgi:predicted Zn-dependent protease
VELPPGRYEVVLEPTAVGDVLSMLAFYGFNGKAVVERRSFVALGAKQFDDQVTLIDDATAPDAVGLPFDVEGTTRGPLTLVDRGVTAAVAHDRRTAVRAGVGSTGHAILGGGAAGAAATNLRLLPAAAPPEASTGQLTTPERSRRPDLAEASTGQLTTPERSRRPGLAEASTGQLTTPPSEVDGPAADSAVAALIAGVGRGLLVTDNHYTRVLDPRTLVVTGLTRNGVWLIENGQVTTPVKNFRFTQSYPDALGPGAVLGVGTHAIGLPGAWSGAGFVAPALRLAVWNYTGGASG